jgi:hypothetical protein
LGAFPATLPPLFATFLVSKNASVFSVLRYFGSNPFAQHCKNQFQIIHRKARKENKYGPLCIIKAKENIKSVE